MFRRLFSLTTNARSITNAKLSSKLETGITGLPASPTAPQTLFHLLRQLHSEASELPHDHVYAQGILATVKHRLAILEDGQRGVVAIEEAIGEGQLEEVIEQVKAELSLLEKMKTWLKTDSG